ncbi:MAG: type IX secretion system outer membrane channel protein PorV [Bacteroidales bacterium]|nr:type IX secretion system outer membrane channel protein PorV [Bacteroidales bacterium]
MRKRQIRLLGTSLMIGLMAVASPIKAQQNPTPDELAGKDVSKNYISTAMPILLIAPDARSGGMGDVGVASTPDVYSAHWNNAKFAFIEKDMGIGMSYVPWLRKLGAADMNLLYLSGYKRINDRSTLAASLTYFSLGNIEFTHEDGTSMGTYKPNEFGLDLSYSMKLSDNFSLGATGRYIRSDLTQGVDVGTTQTRAGNAIAADLGMYYQSETNMLDIPGELAAGLMISNLGSKISYSDDETEKDFLPTNFRFGGRYTMNFDEYNSVSILADFNKLLVPTPPVYDENGEIISGKPDDVGTIQGAFQSFFDAPGGLSEEFQEMQISVGAEYWYDKIFAVRGGYFFEHENKGGRQYITLGGTIKYQSLALDISYLIPTTTLQTSPLANTVRISLAMNFDRRK